MALTSTLKETLLHPLFSGPILLVTILLSSPTLPIATTKFLPPSILSTLTTLLPPTSAIIKTLATLLTLSLLRKTNTHLNDLASRNWNRSPPTWDWPHEVAVITGGSNGIGLCIVKLLLEKGLTVVIMDIKPPPRELNAIHHSPTPGEQDDDNISTTTKTIVDGQESKLHYLPTDLSHLPSLTTSLTHIKTLLIASPTILINNAGISTPIPTAILSTPPTLLSPIFTVNLLSHWQTTQSLLPAMLASNKGHIITLASLSSFLSIPNGAVYSATKAGALAFHEALTAEIEMVYCKSGVLTTVVHPYWTRTGLVSRKVKERLDDGGVRWGGRGREMLTPEGVAGEVVGGILEGRGGVLVLPGRMGVVAGLRGASYWVQRVVWGRLGGLTVGLEGDDGKGDD